MRRSCIPKTPLKNLDSTVVDNMDLPKGNGNKEERGKMAKTITHEAKIITRTRTGSSGADDLKRFTRTRGGFFTGGMKRLRDEESDGAMQEI